MAKRKKKRTLSESVDKLAKEVRLLREENERLRESSRPSSGGNMCGWNRCSCGEWKYPDASSCEKCYNAQIPYFDSRDG